MDGVWAKSQGVLTNNVVQAMLRELRMRVALIGVYFYIAALGKFKKTFAGNELRILSYIVLC